MPVQSNHLSGENINNRKILNEHFTRLLNPASFNEFYSKVTKFGQHKNCCVFKYIKEKKLSQSAHFQAYLLLYNSVWFHIDLNIMHNSDWEKNIQRHSKREFYPGWPRSHLQLGDSTHGGSGLKISVLLLFAWHWLFVKYYTTSHEIIINLQLIYHWRWN